MPCKKKKLENKKKEGLIMIRNYICGGFFLFGFAVGYILGSDK